MGQKDLTAKNFLLHRDIFADTLNALAYAGRNTVHAEDLLPAPTESFYHVERGKLANQFGDAAMYEMRSGHIHVHPEALLLMMKALTGDKRYLKIRDTLSEKEKEGNISMCELLNKYENRGIQKEIQKGIQQEIPKPAV